MKPRRFTFSERHIQRAEQLDGDEWRSPTEPWPTWAQHQIQKELAGYTIPKLADSAALGEMLEKRRGSRVAPAPSPPKRLLLKPSTLEACKCTVTPRTPGKTGLAKRLLSPFARRVADPPVAPLSMAKHPMQSPPPPLHLQRQMISAETPTHRRSPTLDMLPPKPVSLTLANKNLESPSSPFLLVPHNTPKTLSKHYSQSPKPPRLMANMAHLASMQEKIIATVTR